MSLENIITRADLARELGPYSRTHDDLAALKILRKVNAVGTAIMVLGGNIAVGRYSL